MQAGPAWPVGPTAAGAPASRGQDSAGRPARLVRAADLEVTPAGRAAPVGFGDGASYNRLWSAASCCSDSSLRRFSILHRHQTGRYCGKNCYSGKSCSVRSSSYLQDYGWRYLFHRRISDDLALTWQYNLYENEKSRWHLPPFPLPEPPSLINIAAS